MHKNTCRAATHLWRRRTLKVAKQITSKQNWKISAIVSFALNPIHSSIVFPKPLRRRCIAVADGLFVQLLHKSRLCLASIWEKQQQQKYKIRQIHVTQSEKYIFQNQRRFAVAYELALQMDYLCSRCTNPGCAWQESEKYIVHKRQSGK